MQRAEWAWLLASLFLALGLRLSVATVPMCINTDGVFFVQLAAQIGDGGSYFHPTVAITPGYSAILAFLHQVFGASIETIARYLSALCGALYIVPAFFAWRLLFGARAAGGAALLTACWPMSVEYGGGVFYEPLSLLCLFSGWYIWLLLLRGGHWAWAIAVALCWGAVTWMKPEILAWPVLGAAALVWQNRWRQALLLVGVAALVYFPYIAMVHGQSGEWRIAAKQDINALKAQAIGQADYHAALEALRDEGDQRAVAVGFPGPITLAKRLLVNVLLVHRYAISMNWPPFLIALVAVGFYLAWCQRALGFWLMLPLLAALPLLFFQVEARIWHPLFAIMMGLAGLAMARAEGILRWAVLAIALVLLVPQALRPVFRTDVDAAQRAAGLWLSEHAQLGDTVIDRKPFVSYYAGLPLLWPAPQPGIAGLERIMRAHASAVLVVDNTHFRRSRPEWFAALEYPPEWLEERVRFSGPDGHVVRLFSYRWSP